MGVDTKRPMYPNLDISRVELVADARRGVRSHSHPMASAAQRRRCGQIGSPEGWRSPNLPQPAAGTNCHRPTTTQTQSNHLNYILISFPFGDLHEIFRLNRSPRPSQRAGGPSSIRPVSMVSEMSLAAQPRPPVTPATMGLGKTALQPGPRTQKYKNAF